MSSAPLISTHLYILALSQNLLPKATNKPRKCLVISFLSVKIQFIGSDCEVNPCQTQTYIESEHIICYETDQNALRINTSTCQSLSMHEKLK